MGRRAAGSFPEENSILGGPHSGAGFGGWGSRCLPHRRPRRKCPSEKSSALSVS